MKSKIALVLIAAVMILGITGCSKAENIGEWSITVEVAGEAPFEFTNEDAKEIGPVEITAAVKDGDNLLEENVWKGILLYDFLDYIGVEEFSVISVEGADGSVKELEPDRIDENGTGFGWMVDGEMLDEERGPIQLINNNRGPKWWIAQVSYITIIE